MTRETHQRFLGILNARRKFAPNLAILIVDMLLLGSLGGLLEHAYWLGQLAIALLAFHAFALLHECGHGTFSRRRWVNFFVGHAASMLCALPYLSWQRIHSRHHAWAGNLDKDPTLSGLKEILDGKAPRKKKLMEFAWKWWVPAIALNQHVLVWKHATASTSFLTGAYLAVFLFWPFSFAVADLAPGFFLFLVVTEVVNAPHHLGKALFRGNKKLSTWEQTEVTRTGFYPAPFSEILFLNFNLHIEHHLFPQLPWHRLRAARKLLCSEMGQEYDEAPGLKWSLTHRRKSPLEITRPPRKKIRSAWNRKVVRTLGRVIPWLPKTWRHSLYRQSLHLDDSPSPKLRVKIAETAEEWDAAFRLLYDAYVDAGLMPENRWHARVTKYHALPTTTTIVAYWGEKIVGTLSIVQDSRMGVPMDAIFDLAETRRGKMIAEISALAIQKEFHADAGKIIFPLTKFMWEYATRFIHLDRIVAAVHPKMADFYEAILMMSKLGETVVPSYSFVNQKPAVGLVLDFGRAEGLAFRAYCGRERKKDLFRYFKCVRLSHFQFPERRFFKSFDATLTRELLYYFLIHRSDVWARLKPEEKSLLFDKPEMPEPRFPSQLQAQAALDDTGVSVHLRNVSRNGFRATAPIAFRDEVTLTLKISETLTVDLRAKRVWSRGGDHGFQITDRPEAWGTYIRYLQGEAV